jgi:excisionase family DNA binding protein
VTGRLVTARQVADILDVSAETVLRWTRQGELRGYRLPGTARGRLRYRLDEIEAWLEARATAGDATRGVSPAPDATRRREVSSEASPVPLDTHTRRARTEEEP